MTKCECGRPEGQCIKGDMDHCDPEADHGFICPVTSQPCLTEQDEFCEEYGCARKARINVGSDEWS